MSNSRLKANLFDLDKGYYLSKNDPLFWNKLFQRQADNPEAMFHVGMAAEREAKDYLEKFYTTRGDKYLNLYRKTIARSCNLVKSSFRKGFIPARLDCLRIEREMHLTDLRIAELNRPTSYSKKQIILIFISAVILSILGAYVFLPHTESLTMKEHNHAYMLPYEVIEGIPPELTAISDNRLVINIPEKDSTKEKIVNALIEKLKMEYEINPLTAKQVVAVDDKDREIGRAIWEGNRENIQVYIPTIKTEIALDNKKVQLWETTTVVRSALYQFVKKNGYMPKELSELNQGYPNNYLTEFPREPYKMKNTVTTSPTRDGGWLFSYVEFSADKDLVSLVKEALKPNLSYDKDIPFTPLRILIDKDNNNLFVLSENRIIRDYPVALGKDNATPEGKLFLSKKVVNPDKNVPQNRNVYGTRAMELANMNYAIHGTNTPSTIGRNISQGCVRMNNSEIEELYAMIPLNTEVEISHNLSDIIPIESDGYVPPRNLYSNSGNLREEDPFTDYHWAD
ncbi:hypothetical protein DP73_15045 [Desulfosporosinus sp. HMP52]|uniref:L,D-transpeptidase n=1 Tax=Desulfosporosinus sp. HMP52 TaxID=1487923 RepID=UPI00051FD131|nr:L,D-transpeptidase [Desulfosporosinus sp. HMP52]KGK87135.1 hypothetical protein DP73_15045 [Desulfosporosinus sp. HMP52]